MGVVWGCCEVTLHARGALQLCMRCSSVLSALMLYVLTWFTLCGQFWRFASLPAARNVYTRDDMWRVCGVCVYMHIT